MTWEVEFYEDENGRQPAREFLLGLTSAKRAALIAAIEAILRPQGLDVCRSEYGKPLGQGLYEFRVRHDEKTIRRKAGGSGGVAGGEVLLRVFFTAYGDRVVLLLGGYDKGVDPSARRQSREIDQARKRLRSFRLQRQRRGAAKRRRPSGA